MTEATQKLPRARYCKSHPSRDDAQLENFVQDIVSQVFVVMFGRGWAQAWLPQ